MGGFSGPLINPGRALLVICLLTVSVAGKSAVGESLTASKVDSVNTFDMPNAVVPRSISANVQGGKVMLKLEPKSVTVISVGQ